MTLLNFVSLCLFALHVLPINVLAVCSVTKGLGLLVGSKTQQVVSLLHGRSQYVTIQTYCVKRCFAGYTNFLIATNLLDVWNVVFALKFLDSNMHSRKV